ncbi:MAG TPA: hypothetical protein VIL11_00300 [Limnochordales bacterium]
MEDAVTDVGPLDAAGRRLRARRPLAVQYLQDPEGGGQGFVAFYQASTEEGYFGPYGWGESPEQAREDLLQETLAAWRMYVAVPEGELPEPARKRRRFLVTHFEVVSAPPPAD